MTLKSRSRRQFLKTTSGASAGLMLSGAAAPSFAGFRSENVNLPNKLTIKPQRKALVFIMLDGGNDSFNMLVPTTNQHYQEYQQTRSNLALEKSKLLPLNGFEDHEGRRFGLHPNMPEVQKLFNQKQLSFVANIGPLIEPVTKASYVNRSAQIPLGLLSHADQFKHWQTSRPHQRINQGWFGFLADSLQPGRSEQQIPMNVSLAGSNIMQNGVEATHYSITDKGSVGLVINEEDTPLNNAILESFEGLLRTPYKNDPFKQTYLAQTREAQALHEQFRQATANVNVPVSFSKSDLSQQLRKVAQSIKAADQLGTKQQTFFLRYIGWDHHDELLNNHARMLGVLSKALGEFQQALNQMGLADKVVTFTGSDFGRTLTSNGNGTDHGWGGNTLVMGQPIQGGQVFGQYPDLSLGESNALDSGDGVLIPTTPTDALYAELSRWYGVADDSLVDLFPNLNKFQEQYCNVSGVVKGQAACNI